MITFEIHDVGSVSPASRELLLKAKEKMGFVPNIFGVMAESPATLKGYLTLAGIFDESSFTPTERQVLLLTASRENGCQYCVAAYSLSAMKAGAPKAVVDAIREDKPIADPRLAALHKFCRSVVEKRGWVSDAEVKAFLDAGFTKAQVLEVVLAVSLKTLTNYVNHIAATPLDAAFQNAKWTGKARAA